MRFLVEGQRENSRSSAENRGDVQILRSQVADIHNILVSAPSLVLPLKEWKPEMETQLVILIYYQILS